ncbi:hypothetical protein [Halorhabdus rudnickae]|uniref:hypothetical protein n=1 Tax=Halorhabdus rudnickae TaxID=1775544 RepID=UPI001084714B|nr:hypothetical protein [Halorhabdus rudnickae]
MTAYRHRIDNWQFVAFYVGITVVIGGVAYVALGAIDRTVTELPRLSLVLGGVTGAASMGMAYVETLENWFELYEPYGINVVVFLPLLFVWIESLACFAGFTIGYLVGLVATLAVGEVSLALRSSM